MQLRFRTGELIVDYVTDTPDGLDRILGRVVLLPSPESGADPLDVVEPGGVFGFFPLLSEGKVSFTRASGGADGSDPNPGPQVRTVFHRPRRTVISGDIGVGHDRRAVIAPGPHLAGRRGSLSSRASRCSSTPTPPCATP